MPTDPNRDPDAFMDDAIAAFVDEVDALVKAGRWSKDGVLRVQEVVSGVRVRVELAEWVDPPQSVLRHQPRTPHRGG